MGELDAIRITTSRGQGQDREGLSEGSPSAKLRAEEHEPHRRLGLRASWHHTTKPEGSADRVNAAVVQRKRMFLFGEICSARAPGRRWAKNQKGLLVDQGPGAGGGCQLLASERGSDAHRGLGARLRVIGGVTEQKSAEAVLAAVSGEGLNMRVQGGVVNDSRTAWNPPWGSRLWASGHATGLAR